MSEGKNLTRRSLLPTKKAIPAIKASNQQRQAFSVAIENDVLVLRLPLIPADKRKISKSGKSIICAGTGGTKIARQSLDGIMTPVEIDGKAMRICATAWVGCDKTTTDAETENDDPSQEGA